ncbi:MAG: phage tail protein [Bacteroidota bacterium]
MAKGSDAVNYPPVGFYFSVDLAQAVGAPPSLKATVDNSFQEVSGLSAEMETESVIEGGENRFTHKVPKRTTYQNLILKRGLILSNSNFSKWCLEVLAGNLSKPIVPKNITVSLLNERGKPAMTWQFFNAWPVKVLTSDFQSMENKIVVETLEFAFQYFEQKAA